ncbi:MAG: extracellular solute-binding protein, partial [Alphaproteobacteria bacterium]
MALRLTSGVGILAAVFSLVLFWPLPPTAAQDTGVTAGVTVSHGFAIHGTLKYGPDFAHFDYVNPDAPKGGDVVLSANGGFDSLNGFILKGDPAAGLGLIYDTLLVGSSDEAFSSYGLLAQSIEYPEDRSWAIYNLRPEARWHDGVPLTADDVVWSFETLTTQGHPQLREYWSAVTGVEKLDDHRVRFDFGTAINREMPSIIGQLTILPKHYWLAREFGETTLDVPLGSGPYRIKAVDPGRSITYERVADYWGRNVPVNVGQNNLATIRYDYYRDRAVEREALKAGAIDFFQENVAREWATAYDTPALRDGRLIKEEIANDIPQGMQGFALNTRRPALADRRVRQALTLAMDFEWMNKTFFFESYRRSRSYFTNTDMEAKGLPG